MLVHRALNIVCLGIAIGAATTADAQNKEYVEVAKV